MKRTTLVRLAVAGLVLTPLWAAPSSSLRPARADEGKHHPMLEAMEHVFNVSQKEELKEYQVNDTTYAPNSYNGFLSAGWFKVGEPKVVSNMSLRAGVEYAVIAGAESRAIKLNLKVVDTRGKLLGMPNDPVVTESTDDGQEASAVFKPARAGRFGFRIEVEKAPEGVESTFVAVALLCKPGGWEVPRENLKVAAAAMEKRLNKLRESAQDAEFAFEGAAISGVVVPRGGLAGWTGRQELLAENDHVILAAGDGNADPITATLGSFFRGPRPEETLDEAPAVTYRRGGGVRDVVFQNGKGDTSLLLMGIVVAGKK